LLTGKPGTGKSYVGYLLAASMNAKIITKLALDKHQSDFIYLYKLYKEDTTIYVFNEIDILFEKIKDGIPQNKDMNSFIYDKRTWNDFLDDVKIIYPNIIIILTTNLTKKELQTKYDESFIRKGRVDLIYEMNQVIDSI
jgi:broad-specificity NMP kinase